MKGTLHKTEQEWVVKYPISSVHPTLQALPLHPDEDELKMVMILNVPVCEFEGKEVEFEIVIHKETSKHYAKLIPSKEQQKELIKEIMDLDAKDGLYEDTSHRGYPRPDDVDKFEQDAWDNYEHVEGNLYSTTFRNAFKLGYNKAKETLYTEEQVRVAMSMARKLSGVAYTNDEIIQSLKQPKKD